MAIFSYTAINRKGKEVKGIVDAPNVQTARKKLKADGLYVRKIAEDAQKREKELFPFLAKFLYRIPRKEVGLFVKQLGTLLGAGIPLDKSLASIIEQTDNPNLKKIIIEIRSDITEGTALSEAMAKHGDVFPSQYSSLVEVGEKTGEYEKVLNRLAELEQKNSEMKGKVQTAMVYPLIIGSISFLVAIFLLTVVIPQIQELFIQMEAELPLITRMVIYLSAIITGYWWLILILFGGAITLFVKYTSTPNGRRQFQNFIIKIPLVGPMYKKVLVSRFTSNLGVLVYNKVPLISSLTIVATIVDNVNFREEILDAINRIKEGSKLSDSMHNSQILPQMVLGMVAAGEMSDQVPEMLMKLSEIYENELDSAIKSMTQSLEPLLIVVMGGMIFLIMASIMTPMYQLTNNLKNF